METKQCTKCKKMKPLDEFRRMTASKDGRHHWCRQCMKEYNHQRYVKHREERLAYQRQYRAKNLEKVKERQRRYYAKHHVKIKKAQKAKRVKKVKKRVALRCTDNLSYSQRYRIENAGRYRTYTANRHALSMAAGGTFTDEQFAELCEQYDNRCLCCSEAKKLTVDHVIPLSRGGANDISNLQPLCQPCNSSKGTKTIDYRTGPMSRDMRPVQLSLPGLTLETQAALRLGEL